MTGARASSYPGDVLVGRRGENLSGRAMPFAGSRHPSSESALRRPVPTVPAPSALSRARISGWP